MVLPTFQREGGAYIAIRSTFAYRQLWKIRRGSLAFDVGRLDDRPPLLDFSFLKCAQSFGRLLLAGIDILSKVRKLLAHCWFGHRTNNGIVELHYDLSCSAFRCPNAVPL